MSDWVRERFMREDNPNRSSDYATKYLLGSWDAVPAHVSDERLLELQDRSQTSTRDELASMAYELWNRRRKESNPNG